jgi:broad specificity phosphatase PhoE
LDAEDKSWYLHSPTPYDSPLSYGGWNQSKSLGARITKILTSRDSGLTTSPQRPKKIVIHSSPFLRCIQTAIGISAGIGQSVPKFYSNVINQPRSDLERNASHDVDGRKSRPRERIIYTRRLSMQTLQEEDEDPQLKLLEKPILRIDAFLGEWLSPEYFEHITPPPSSPLLVLSAKAELLTEEHLDAFEPSSNLIGHFPGGWQKAQDFDYQSITDEVPRIDMTSGRSSLAQALSRHRASSQSRISDASGASSNSASTSSAFLAYGGYYHPPVPTYAVSPTELIPRGYVAHARQMCVDVDIQWDSLKEPQEWGDGGELPEEWSSMHRRFRGGLLKMMDWYKSNSPIIETEEDASLSVESDDDYELIVIIVTHSAGCNALIGALTNQPVLIDVGQASLTFATRRNLDLFPPLSSSPTSHRMEANQTGLSTDYDVVVQASVDHLRGEAGPSSLTGIMSTQSPKLKPTQDSTRVPENLTIWPPPRKLSRASRTFSSSSASSLNSSNGPTRSSTLQSSGGLWKKSTAETTDQNTPSSQKIMTNEQPSLSPLHQTQQDPTLQTMALRVRPLGNDEDHGASGLWSEPKRRWTTTESNL